MSQRWAVPDILQMSSTICSFITLGTIHPPTRCHVPKDFNFQHHFYTILKSYGIKVHTHSLLSHSVKRTVNAQARHISGWFWVCLPLTSIKDKQKDHVPVNTDPCNNNHSSQHSGSVGCKQPLWPFLQNKETSSAPMPQFMAHEMCSYLKCIFAHTTNTLSQEMLCESKWRSSDTILKVLPVN